MSTLSPGSRPLAPAPPPATAQPATVASSSGAQANNYVSGIKRASTACQSCKQIKRKCDQARPCSNCRKSQTRCVYNEGEDGRRKAARKRTVESLELKRDALESILDMLRTSDDQNVQMLVQLIKSQAPLEQIVQYATSHADGIPEAQLQHITTIVNGQPRRSVLSVSDLCDTPLVRVPAKPWTTVSDDDEFVSHLISIYFTWFHVAYPVLDKNLFLHDMQSGDLASPFCSRLLVNAMLTVACHFSDHPRACKTPSVSDTRGRHFFDESTRLWHEQESRPSLHNAQAMLILAVTSTMMGKDRLSWSYLGQANTMIQELIDKNAQAEARQMQWISPEMKRSQSLVLRANFLLTVGFGSAFMKPLPQTASLQTTRLSDPILDEIAIWFPYPQRTPEVSFAFNDLHVAYYTLHDIGADILRQNFGNDIMSQQQEVKDLDRRLQTWKEELSSSLLLNESRVIEPPIMDLHLTYFWFRITLFNFIKTNSTNMSTPTSSPDSTHKYARSQIIVSAEAIANLCKLYTRDYGLKQPTIWMPQTSASAAYSLIDLLPDSSEENTISDTFHELCLILVAASRRWLVMKGHVRMLLLTAEEKGRNLLKKTRDLLQFVALDQWGENDHLHFASASYPNYALAKGNGPFSASMADLLEKWADFELSKGAVENAALEDDITVGGSSDDQTDILGHYASEVSSNAGTI